MSTGVSRAPRLQSKIVVARLCRGRDMRKAEIIPPLRIIVDNGRGNEIRAETSITIRRLGHDLVAFEPRGATH
jgi:hypothetical protein